MTSIPTITDEDLVAYLDDALEPGRRHQIEAALAGDEALQARIAALEIDKEGLQAAFAQIAAGAPVAALQAGIKERMRHLDVATDLSRTWMRIAAALVIGAVLGYGVRFAMVEPAVGDWRVAVAAYHRLYTTATLASIAGEAANRRAEVALVSAKLGLALKPEALEIDGLDFKRAQLLEFEGTPLGQFAYLDRAGVPIAFCAIRTGEPDRGIGAAIFRGLNAASWSKDGYGYIVIGASDAGTLERIAATLAPRI